MRFSTTVLVTMKGTMMNNPFGHAPFYQGQDTIGDLIDAVEENTALLEDMEWNSYYE